jgi:hypothetical protein
MVACDRVSKTAKIVLAALHDAIGECGEVPPACSHIPRGVKCVTINQWRTYVYQSRRHRRATRKAKSIQSRYRGAHRRQRGRRVEQLGLDMLKQPISPCGFGRFILCYILRRPWECSHRTAIWALCSPVWAPRWPQRPKRPRLYKSRAHGRHFGRLPETPSAVPRIASSLL